MTLGRFYITASGIAGILAVTFHSWDIAAICAFTCAASIGLTIDDIKRAMADAIKEEEK